MMKTDKKLGMNELSKTVFAPIYPVIAKDIIRQCGITGGYCIDLGSGPAMLSIALAGLAEKMDILLLDSSRQVQEMAAENVKEAGFSDRLTPLTSDVHHLPFRDDSIDLAVSRGSIFFWDDPSRVLMEVYRVLAVGGSTFIGGGFGNESLKRSIFSEMTAKNPDWPKFTERNIGQRNRKRLTGIVEGLGIPHSIQEDNAGFWIIISKK